MGLSRLAIAAPLLFACARRPAVEAADLGPAPALDALMERALRRYELEGLSAAVVRADGVLWSAGAGFAGEGQPATRDTVYPVASLTKPITAVAVLQLAAEGRLDLDAPVADVLPEFTVQPRFPDAPPITPRHLLTHHAGLAQDRLAGAVGAAPPPFRSVLPWLAAEPPSFAPGEIFSYSNLGFDVLGAVIEAVEGEPYAAAMTRRVLGPLGMKTASFARDPSRPLATGYALGAPRPPVEVRDTPAVGLYASATDLAALARMVLSGGEVVGRRVLDAESTTASISPQNAASPLDGPFRIGMPWWLDRASYGGRAGTLAAHSGSNPYCQGHILLAPDRDLGVVVLMNSNDALVAPTVAFQLLEAALGYAGLPEDAVPPYSLAAAPPEATPGWYATAQGMLQVEDTGDGLQLKGLGIPLRLDPAPGGLYRPQLKVLGLPMKLPPLESLRIFFATDGVRRSFGVSIPGIGPVVLGGAIEPSPPTPAWEARLGAWEIANLAPGEHPLFDRPSLAVEEGFVVLKYEVQPGFSAPDLVLPLALLSDEEAVVQGLGTGFGDAVHVTRSPSGERLEHAGLVMVRADGG